jgi:hypothetical protein
MRTDGHTDRQTDRLDEVNNSFSQFCEKRLKSTDSGYLGIFSLLKCASFRTWRERVEACPYVVKWRVRAVHDWRCSARHWKQLGSAWVGTDFNRLSDPYKISLQPCGTATKKGLWEQECCSHSDCTHSCYHGDLVGIAFLIASNNRRYKNKHQ